MITSAFVDAVAVVARTGLGDVLNLMFSNSAIRYLTYELPSFVVENGILVPLLLELTTVEAVFGCLLAVVPIVAGVRLVPPACTVVPVMVVGVVE